MQYGTIRQTLGRQMLGIEGARVELLGPSRVSPLIHTMVRIVAFCENDRVGEIVHVGTHIVRACECGTEECEHWAR